MTIEQVLALVGAVSVILTVIANMPGVSATRAGQVLLKLTAIDFVGLAKAVGAFMPKKPAELPPPSDK